MNEYQEILTDWANLIEEAATQVDALDITGRQRVFLGSMREFSTELKVLADRLGYIPEKEIEHVTHIVDALDVKSEQLCKKAAGWISLQQQMLAQHGVAA